MKEQNFASMKDIKRKCNLKVDLLKFTYNKKKKKIKWICSLSLQPSLLSNFV